MVTCYLSCLVSHRRIILHGSREREVIASTTQTKTSEMQRLLDRPTSKRVTPCDKLMDCVAASPRVQRSQPSCNFLYALLSRTERQVDHSLVGREEGYLCTVFYHIINHQNATREREGECIYMREVGVESARSGWNGGSVDNQPRIQIATIEVSV